MAGGRVRSFCAGWGTLTPHKGNCRITQCDNVSGSGQNGKQMTSSDAVIRAQESTHKVPKSTSQAVISRMQLTLHATLPTHHVASRLAQAMSVWSDIHPVCSVPAL